LYFHIHPDGRIKFENNDGKSYADTMANFKADGGSGCPDLAEGARVDISLARSALFQNGGQSAAGEVWDGYAAETVGMVESYLAAQAARRENDAAAQVSEAEAKMTFNERRQRAYVAAGLTIQRLSVALLDKNMGDLADLAQYVEERDTLRADPEFPPKLA